MKYCKSCKLEYASPYIHQCTCGEELHGSPSPFGSALPVGETIKVGDLFRDCDGNMVEVDRKGLCLGVSCAGKTVRKSGDWFRLQKQIPDTLNP